jgi:hypothetical protein
MAKIFVISRRVDAYDSNQLSNYLHREFGKKEVFTHISGKDDKPLHPLNSSTQLRRQRFSSLSLGQPGSICRMKYPESEK